MAATVDGVGGAMTLSGREGFRVLVDHRPDCLFADSPRPFLMHVGMEWGRNKNGVGRGMWAWHRFCCNDSDCPAVIAVRIDVLSDWVGRG